MTLWERVAKAQRDQADAQASAEPLLLYSRNRSALAVNCCVIIYCLEAICKEGHL